MKILLVITLLSCFLSSCLSKPQFCVDPPTADYVVSSMYLGKWYQIAEDRFTRDFTERDAVCATANYGLNPNGTISVLNYARLINNTNGTVETIAGWASQDKTYPGRLTVYLQGTPFGDIGAPYWILKLGPVVNNQYSYSVISDPVCVSLFVLARTPTISKDVEKEIKDFLRGLGYNVERDYIPLVQEGCNYGPTKM